MNYISRNLNNAAAMFAVAAIGITAVSVFGQDAGNKDRASQGHKDRSKSFCSSENRSSDGRASYREIREMNVSAGGTISVDGGQNGGISVTGEERSDVLVRACVQTWGTSDESAKTAAGNITIGTSGTIKAATSGEDKNWSVSYHIQAPRASNLNLTANNGGISIKGVDGSMEFKTLNGGISISDVSGEVKGSTTNGGIMAYLTGASWKGAGLDLTTKNGGVKISMPANYAAQVDTGTVNGGFKSNVPALAVEKDDSYGRRRATRTSTAINGGGAPIRVVTTNGGVNIDSRGD